MDLSQGAIGLYPRCAGSSFGLGLNKKKVLLSQYLFTFSKKGTNTHVAVKASQDSSHWAWKVEWDYQMRKGNGILSYLCNSSE